MAKVTASVTAIKTSMTTTTAAMATTIMVAQTAATATATSTATTTTATPAAAAAATATAGSQHSLSIVSIPLTVIKSVFDAGALQLVVGTQFLIAIQTFIH